MTALNGGSTYAENASQKDIFGGLYVERMYKVHSYFLQLQNLEGSPHYIRCEYKPLKVTVKYHLAKASSSSHFLMYRRVFVPLLSLNKQETSYYLLVVSLNIS